MTGDETTAAALARFFSTQPAVRLAILFGSRARGRAGAGADLDVAVLGREHLDSLQLGAELEAALGSAADVVELDHIGYPLRQAILREGVVVYAQQGAEAEWRTRAILQNEDEGPLYRRMSEAFLGRLAASRR